VRASCMRSRGGQSQLTVVPAHSVLDVPLRDDALSRAWSRQRAASPRCRRAEGDWSSRAGRCRLSDRWLRRKLPALRDRSNEDYVRCKPKVEHRLYWVGHLDGMVEMRREPRAVAPRAGRRRLYSRASASRGLAGLGRLGKDDGPTRHSRRWRRHRRRAGREGSRRFWASE
jgi:hypothetical protein